MGITLEQFIKESNAIERIYRELPDWEVDASDVLLIVDTLTFSELYAYVIATEPTAKLRNKRGMDVQVGNHIPPRGAPDIELELVKILNRISNTPTTGHLHAFEIHKMYETLHPFTDGNGRSGRMLWLRMMGGEDWLKEQYMTENVFLHWWYYQSLGESR